MADVSTFPILSKIVRVLPVCGLMVSLQIVAAVAQTHPMTDGALPGTAKDLKFERYISGLDLEDTERYLFHAKTGGTSLGFKISERGKRKKAVYLAHGGSSYPEGEVVSYRLSRLLGVSRFFNPVDYYVLGPKATRRFRTLMIHRRHKNKWRRHNVKMTKMRLARRPGRLAGIVKYRHKRRSQPVNRLSTGIGLNRRHILARYLVASNAQPPSTQMRLRGVGRDKKIFPHPSERADELARQLSIIFVIDMLTAQWDRFSGGNIEIYALKDGRLRFVARDNGGATLEGRWAWYKKYSSWVSRFDVSLIRNLKSLNAFLQGRREYYKNFRSQETLKAALGFRRKVSFVSFKKKLRHFTEERLPNLERRYGSRIYFDPIEPEQLVVARAVQRIPVLPIRKRVDAAAKVAVVRQTNRTGVRRPRIVRVVRSVKKNARKRKISSLRRANRHKTRRVAKKNTVLKSRARIIAKRAAARKIARSKSEKEQRRKRMLQIATR